MVDYQDTNRYKAMMNSDENAMIMRNAIAHLLRAASILSPTTDIEIAFTQLAQRGQANGKPRTAIVGELLAAMLDGVSCGGWPDNNGL